MQLSRSFALSEFLRSETAARLGRPITGAAPEIEGRLRALCLNVLQPLRDDLRRGVFILSGYRPPWLNTAIGGARNSQHCRGEAADIEVAGLAPIQLCRRIIALELPFDQLILEFGQWVHVSHARGNRGRILTAVHRDGKTLYLSGVVDA